MDYLEKIEIPHGIVLLKDNLKIKVIDGRTHDVESYDPDYAENIHIIYYTPNTFGINFEYLNSDYKVAIDDFDVSDMEIRPNEAFIEKRWVKKYLLFGPYIEKEVVSKTFYTYPLPKRKKIKMEGHRSNLLVQKRVEGLDYNVENKEE